ncbi:Uma2 family endonuclease [Hymenobacter perfusus]|uniref:Uma2 family endonuclease n=1 Tax=Hymenobacter perfusus TaxID=1236770 RepID=A0A428K181_9BACT|nr:Uma2 family endonuclease [Hymenobacter perfusus]RSK40113.1 Uma2 family endonuclease [Hymenobacter perfusus]
MKPFYEPFVPGQLYSVAEFLALEQQAEDRHEFYDGQVWPFPADTLRHNLLVQNCSLPLFARRKQVGLDVFSNGMLLEVIPGGYYTYPDVVIRDFVPCSGLEYVVQCPKVIVEVLDPLWAERDRTWKCVHYRRLESLQQYVLVSQTQQFVESYWRTAAGEWRYEAFMKPDDVLDIADTGLQLMLREIYDEVAVPLLQLQFPDIRETIK